MCRSWHSEKFTLTLASNLAACGATFDVAYKKKRLNTKLKLNLHLSACLLVFQISRPFVFQRWHDPHFFLPARLSDSLHSNIYFLWLSLLLHPFKMLDLTIKPDPFVCLRPAIRCLFQKFSSGIPRPTFCLPPTFHFLYLSLQFNSPDVRHTQIGSLTSTLWGSGNIQKTMGEETPRGVKRRREEADRRQESVSVRRGNQTLCFSNQLRGDWGTVCVWSARTCVCVCFFRWLWSCVLGVAAEVLTKWGLWVTQTAEDTQN